ncbi:AAA family ATPase [Nostoc sp. UHCC 0302]|uniref:AAA family ATPase n=1 Tax=Nostoc sp. UHCC 0302 TaxID=3134896 RepID=UPI00311C9FD7
MLKQLILENWKSFRYAELPLDPLTVLIGTNASGKSNVVEALEFLQRTFIKKDVKPALLGDSTLSSIRGGLEWAALKPEKQFTLQAVISGENEYTDYIYSITIQTKPIICILNESIISQNYQNNGEEKPKNIFCFKASSNLSNYDRKIDVFENDVVSSVIWGDIFSKTQTILNDASSGFLSELNQDMADKIYNLIQYIENIFILNPLPYKMRNYSIVYDKLEGDASNIAGVLAALSDEQKAAIESTLSEYIKYLPGGDIQRVWAEKVGRFGTDAMLYCQEEWKPGHITEIDARSMSDGTLRFLAILTALLTRPEGSQIVIEEIDSGLHPSRAELLVRILREIGSKRKIDILLTTHNPALLDALGPEIVPFVVVAHRDNETGESKLTLLEDIENFPKLFASYSLGDMTTKGAIERSLSHGE